MAGNIGTADQWAGAAGPKIKPEALKKTWRNDQDPNRRRATFGVSYPLWEITIEKSEDLREKLPAKFEKTDRRVVTGVRFHLKVPVTFYKADFRECKFHRSDAQGESTIEGSAFKNCTFRRCFLGGTLFRHVTFDSCKFERCDLGALNLRSANSTIVYSPSVLHRMRASPQRKLIRLHFLWECRPPSTTAQSPRRTGN